MLLVTTVLYKYANERNDDNLTSVADEFYKRNKTLINIVVISIITVIVIIITGITVTIVESIKR